MSVFVETIINNLNQNTYITNIHRAGNKPNFASDEKKNLTNNNEEALREIDKLEREVRVNNLKVFFQNYSRMKRKRFFLITLPALISALTIGSYAMPSRYDKTKNLPTYNKETVHIDSTHGEIVENEKVYYDSVMSFMEHRAEEPITLTQDYYDIVEARFTDGVKSIYSRFNLTNEGKLNACNVEEGSFIDLSKYDSSNYQELEEKYADLFDNIINKLNETENLTEEQVSLIKELTESDKKQIIVDIVRYYELGPEEVVVNVSRWPLRILLSVITGIYLLALLMCCDSNSINNGNILCDKDGVLIKKNEKPTESIFYGPSRYKAAFLAAEEERIQKISKLAEDNLEFPDLILTKFEKKLINRKNYLC